jgi:hypothetical protein
MIRTESFNKSKFTEFTGLEQQCLPIVWGQFRGGGGGDVKMIPVKRRGQPSSVLENRCREDTAKLTVLYKNKNSQINGAAAHALR